MGDGRGAIRHEFLLKQWRPFSFNGELNMILWRLRYSVITLVSLMLCGCAFSPPAPNDTVNEKNITRSVLTELYCAIDYLQSYNSQNHSAKPDSTRRPNPKFFRSDENWIAEIEISLKTDLEAAAIPELTLIGPVSMLSSAGTYNVAAGAQADQTATSQRDAKMYIDINLLMNQWPLLEAPEGKIDCTATNNKTYLEGKLGIEAWLTRNLQAYQMVKELGPQWETALIFISKSTKPNELCSPDPTSVGPTWTAIDLAKVCNIGANELDKLYISYY
jgi:hypothetical protein